jgi:hypothetical protein
VEVLSQVFDLLGSPAFSIRLIFFLHRSSLNSYVSGCRIHLPRVWKRFILMLIMQLICQIQSMHTSSRFTSSKAYHCAAISAIDDASFPTASHNKPYVSYPLSSPPSHRAS